MEFSAAQSLTRYELRVRVNATLVHQAQIAPNTDYTVELRFEADAFVTVEVEGDPGDVFRAVAPGEVLWPSPTRSSWTLTATGSGAPRGLPPTIPNVLTDPEDTP